MLIALAIWIALAVGFCMGAWWAARPRDYPYSSRSVRAIPIADKGPGVPQVRWDRMIERDFIPQSLGARTDVALAVCLGVVERPRRKLTAEGNTRTVYAILVPAGSLDGRTE